MSNSSAPTLLVLDHLRRHDAAGALLPMAERIMELQQDLGRLLPAGTQEGCEVCGYAEGTLSLIVPTASLASKLRQVLPRLCEGFVRRGWKVNAIQVRVQPNVSIAPMQNNVNSEERAPIPDDALAAMAELANSVSDEGLAKSLAQLVAHHRKPAVKAP
jgi:hypothetical protein